MSRLLARTLELMDACPLTLADLSIQSKINYHWLVGFKYRRSPNPGVVNVEQLYEYLSGRKLVLDIDSQGE